MPEMPRITIRLSRRDLERLDALRGRTDRSKYLRRLLRRSAPQIVPEPDEEEDGPVVDDETFERLRALSRR
jgi:hypothetical protein